MLPGFEASLTHHISDSGPGSTATVMGGVYISHEGGRPSPHQHCCRRRLDVGASSTQVDLVRQPNEHLASGLLKPGSLARPPPHTHTLCPPERRGRPPRACFSGAAHERGLEPETEASKDYRPDPVEHLSLLEPNQVFA